MKRFNGLIRDTWWLWVILLTAGIIAAQFSFVFYSSIPISLFAFFYFGIMRYDSDGNLKEDG